MISNQRSVCLVTLASGGWRRVGMVSFRFKPLTRLIMNPIIIKYVSSSPSLQVDAQSMQRLIPIRKNRKGKEMIPDEEMDRRRDGGREGGRERRERGTCGAALARYLVVLCLPRWKESERPIQERRRKTQCLQIVPTAFFWEPNSAFKFSAHGPRGSWTHLKRQQTSLQLSTQ